MKAPKDIRELCINDHELRIVDIAFVAGHTQGIKYCSESLNSINFLKVKSKL